MFQFLKRRLPDIDYKNLVERLERFDQKDISNLLFEGSTVSYLPVTFTSLAKMAKPLGLTQDLKLHSVNAIGKYELAIFEVPWLNSDLKFLPLILDKKLVKIVGIMLPFNELLTLLSGHEQNQIQQLSNKWVSFAMKQRFGL
jgi:hypothetical protein